MNLFRKKQPKKEVITNKFERARQLVSRREKMKYWLNKMVQEKNDIKRLQAMFLKDEVNKQIKKLFIQ